MTDFDPTTDKKVIATKKPGEPWVITTKGRIQRADINNLVRTLIPRYKRSRRARNLERMRELKRKESHAG